MPNTPVSLRPAVPGDEKNIVALIRRIAEYEKLEDQVEVTPELVRRYLFEEKLIFCLMAEHGGKAVGYALYFFNYSTFTGKPGLYLEDLFFLPEYRGLGGGTACFRALAKIAADKGCGRMEWSCLDWNEPARQFYKAMGAEPMEEWTVFRLNEAQIRRVAEE